MPKKVYVAMSGGVDSSIAALLLKQQGYNVVGVFMKPWQPKGFTCLWKEDRADAMRVAVQLDIPFLTWDFSREYEKFVAGPMIEGYRRGITPNPDVECNRHIKFGLFFNRAIKEGADFIATGHYARILGGKLYKAKDSNKDQTYFLWGIPEKSLSRIIFPIGNLLKPEVRQLAKKNGILTAAKKDSQGVCFIGELNVKDFLTSKIKQRQGKILHVDGRQLGNHDGATYYTIGQRHGLDIKDGAGPYFVVSTDIKKNIIIVGGETDLYGKTIKIKNTNWFVPVPKAGERIMVKIRYRTEPEAAIMSKAGKIDFIKEIRAITPGQSAVIYKGRRMLGGGIII